MPQNAIQKLASVDWFKTLLLSYAFVQLAALALGALFPPIQEFFRTFSLGWIIILIILILWTITRLTKPDLGNKTFFAYLVALIVLIFLLIYLPLDATQLFDASLIRADIAYVGGSIIP